MKKIIIGILICLLNCKVVTELPPSQQKFIEKSLSKVDAGINPIILKNNRTYKSDPVRIDCSEQTKKELNYNNIFSGNIRSSKYRISISCSNGQAEDLKGEIYLSTLLAYLTLFTYPAKMKDSLIINIEVTQNKDKVAAYTYVKNKEWYISWVLLPVPLYQLFETEPNNYDNFIKNTNADIYDKIVAYDKILEEKNLAKQEEDTKAKEQENIKLEAEKKELEEKLKTVKTIMLQIGSAYCLEESYILGITYTTNEDILSKLVFAQVCFQVEDKPLAAKLIPYDKGVYVYVDSQKFYSSKKLLKVK